MKNVLLVFATIIISTLFFQSCSKERFITGKDARVNTSVDSVKFDTVFTTAGSVTKAFKILNNNDQKLLLSSIKLAGGTSSPFKMNVNGIATPELNNVSVAANDSVYVFVTVTVNPTTANLPFILSDSISISYNGLTKFVKLQAYGQNAVFIENGIIAGNITFTNNLPYVILGGLQVINNASLSINAGTKIYCHADAPILIDGTLICNGTKMQPVIFAGDRLDDPYNAYPAAWPGIYFRTASKDNSLLFTSIKNAYQGVVVFNPTVNANPKLILRQSIVDNAFDAALLCSNTTVVAENCLFSNSGRNVHIEKGGNYSLTNCTIPAYSNNYIIHKRPSVFLSDADASNQTAALNATLRNCIIYGDAGFVDNDIQTSKIGNSFNVNIDRSLYRAAIDPANTIFTQSIKNIDPAFDSLDAPNQFYNFRVTKNPLAPGINKGIITALQKDLDDNNRNNGLPDMGAYEKQ